MGIGSVVSSLSSSGKSFVSLNDRMVPAINKYPLENLPGLYEPILKDGLSNRT